MVKDQRLRKKEEFATVLKKGKRQSSNLLVLGVHPNGLQINRYGFSVGKHLGNAVTRNKIKRRLREAIRELPMEKGWDVVVIARRSASSAAYSELREALEKLVENASLTRFLVGNNV